MKEFSLAEKLMVKSSPKLQPLLEDDEEDDEEEESVLLRSS